MKKAWIAVAVLAVVLAVPIGLWLRKDLDENRRVQLAADQTVDMLKAMFAPRHDLLRVNPREYPQRDIAFYDSVQAELEKHGFRVVGDVEDATVSAALPGGRTFMRFMIAADSVTTACFYDALPPPDMLANLPNAWDMNFRILDLSTETEDERFVGTSTMTPGPFATPPAIDITHMPCSTRIEDAVRFQKNKVARYCARKRTVPRRVASLDDALASYQRAVAVAHAHWQARNFCPTTAELMALDNDYPPSFMSKLARELARRREAEEP
ncbi:MAG: hypothetical protein GF331_00435 [Chitinivibrionales bacterium]|nr:hypothetical protein [Chitinivibrionales bacterium]